jgi:membrane-associated phospholipid phosphatase
MMSKMRVTLSGSFVVALVALVASSGCAWSQSNGNSSITRSGDVLQIVLPALAYGGTWYFDDLDGAKQYTKGLALTLAGTEVLKPAVGEWRPDHSNQKSFPSGHAASAFSASAFVRQRYGMAYAAPLYALATYTGYTRVQAKKHYWHDVGGSLALAELSQSLFTDPHKSTSVSMNFSHASVATAQLHLHHSW